jgi:hypothetical protein
MTVFGGADDLKRSKIALVRGGDPDAAEYAELTEIAILASPLKCLRRGVVRILCNLATKRYRLLMRDETGAVLLLNHYLVPPLNVVPIGESVAYTVEDYAPSGSPRRVQVQLHFEKAIVAAYFRNKLNLALQVNAQLMKS